MSSFVRRLPGWGALPLLAAAGSAGAIVMGAQPAVESRETVVAPPPPLATARVASVGSAQAMPVNGAATEAEALALAEARSAARLAAFEAAQTRFSEALTTMNADIALALNAPGQTSAQAEAAGLAVVDRYHPVIEGFALEAAAFVLGESGDAGAGEPGAASPARRAAESLSADIRAIESTTRAAVREMASARAPTGDSLGALK